MRASATATGAAADLTPLSRRYDAATAGLRARCLEHSAGVTRVDFSVDSAYIRSDSRDNHHRYHAAADGVFFPLPTQLRDVEWATQSCLFGWGAQGAHPPMGEGAAATCCHRAALAGGRGDVLLVGDEGGAVAIAKFPCLEKAAAREAVRVHSGPVGAVAASVGGRWVATAGGEDGVVRVWAMVV